FRSTAAWALPTPTDGRLSPAPSRPRWKTPPLKSSWTATARRATATWMTGASNEERSGEETVGQGPALRGWPRACESAREDLVERAAVGMVAGSRSRCSARVPAGAFGCAPHVRGPHGKASSHRPARAYGWLCRQFAQADSSPASRCCRRIRWRGAQAGIEIAARGGGRIPRIADLAEADGSQDLHRYASRGSGSHERQPAPVGSQPSACCRCVVRGPTLKKIRGSPAARFRLPDARRRGETGLPY